MKDENAVKATSLLSIISFIGVALYKGADFQKELLNAITQAVSITILLRFVYVKWLWKWLPWLEYVHSVPYLEGVWSGVFQSTWQPPDGSPPPKGLIEVKISQPNMFTIKVTQKSGESISYSYGESFEHLEDDTIFLNYSYRNEPNASVRHRSQINYGTSRYRLERKNGTMTLKGAYFTDRKSTGDVELTRDRKENE